MLSGEYSSTQGVGDADPGSSSLLCTSRTRVARPLTGVGLG